MRKLGLEKVARLVRTRAFGSALRTGTRLFKQRVLRVPTIGVFAAIFEPDAREKRILLVQQNYRQGQWALPGGRLELGESVTQAVEREILEETGYVARVSHLIGAYSVPAKDDLVLFMEARIESRRDWKPGLEISDARFFAQAELPEKIGRFDRKRIEDAFSGAREVLHTF